MKPMKLGVILLAFLLAAMAMVPLASAESSDHGVTTKYLSPEEGAKFTGADPLNDIGVGGMLKTKTAVVSGSAAFATTEAPQWSAYTDLWRNWWSASPVYCDAYSRSRTSSGSAYDIDKIALRERVWRDGSLYNDQTQTNYNSADAQVNYQYSSVYTGGTWTAQSDHTFELSGYSSWYPVTTDTLT
ncbi:hypothetical protein [Methanoregula sp.]|uniref:hypothetical protein n=1 Tax=Methanoregula sp. TaxID=2052170 RepID=UPI00236A7C80|nr:hypothetical protein [Methanoregula sp.]MDD1685649.1 hypothetical protein [Methanoregula sp.]